MARTEPASPRRTQGAAPAHERILFVELWRLGDAVAATAGLRALRQARPHAKIAVLAHSKHGDPLFRSPDADHRIPFDAFWTRGRQPRDKYLPWTIDYRELARAARRVRDFRPDHVLLFRGDIREQVFCRALGLRNIVDLAGPLPMLPGIGKHRRPASVSRWKEYVFHIEQWAQSPVRAEPTIHLEEPPRREESYVLIHPGASWRYKQWNVARVADLISWLEARGSEVRVVAGPADGDIVSALRSARGGALEVEQPTLNELYSVIAGARLVICNNSAAMHVAEALGTPCIVLTGPSDPVRWGTYRPHSRTVTRSTGLACHPCVDKRCVRPDSPCIDRIELVDVIEAIEDLGILQEPLGSRRSALGTRAARDVTQTQGFGTDLTD